jgi:hypothetical protein
MFESCRDRQLFHNDAQKCRSALRPYFAFLFADFFLFGLISIISVRIHERLVPLKGRRRTGAHDLAWDAPDAAKPVGTMTFEIIGVAGAKYATLLAHGDFQAASQNYSAFFALVRKRDLPGIGAGLISLRQYLERTSQQIVTDLTVRNGPPSDFNQLFGLVKCLLRYLGLDREEFRQANRNAVKNSLQGADRRIRLVRFDQRNR